MAMPYDYAHPFAEVDPILEFSSLGDLLRQMSEFAARKRQFRAGVADTSFFPFSAICKLQMTFPSGVYGGTGFYIAPDLILTAGHNVFDRATGGGTEAATRMTIRPGQQRSGTHLAEFHVTASDWTAHPQWVSSGATSRGFDMAVIRVSTPPPGGEYFEIANYSPAPDAPVAVCGYSSQDVAGDRQHLDIDRVRRLSAENEVVEYNLQTRRGGSGSPVFLDFLNNPGGDMPSAIPVMGVHVARGDATHNRGVLLTPDKIDWARGGGIMSVTQGLSRGFSAAQPGPGGLPLVARSRATLGGLPLLPATPPALPRSGTPNRASNGSMPVAAQQSRYAAPLDRSWIVADPDRGMSVERRTFGKIATDQTGKTKLKVIVRNLPSGGSVHWNIPNADDRRRVTFETAGGIAHSASGTEVTLRSLAPGVARIDCSVKDASGTTIESNKYVVSSPKFVKVVFDPSVDTFLRSVNLASRRGAIVREMRAVIRTIYENVNVRFILPGDAMPAHLDLGANADYPGGRAVPRDVSVIEILGDRTPPDPGHGHIPGAPTNFSVNLFGINHSLNLLPAPFDTTNLINVMLAHFRGIDEVRAVEDVINSSSQPAANLDQAATMYGRLLGETSAHEFGHLPHRTDVDHNRSATGIALPDGLMAEGGLRSFAERTGMAPGSGGALLTDNGLGGINRLSTDNLHDFEESFPVNPPLDAAELRTRGRAGSFSFKSRALSGETVHLPGATILEGWKAETLIFVIEDAIARVMSQGNPGLLLASKFIVDFDRILDVCDSQAITVGFGTAIGFGAAVGETAGAGLVFAPGRRVGFYGALSGVAGAVASAGASGQVTVVRGGPESFGGASFTFGVNVATIGWLDGGLMDVPLGAHVIFDPQLRPIGFTAEIGLSIGIPVFSLLEGYGQAVWTETTIDAVAQGLEQPAADPQGDLRSQAISEAVAKGAPPEQAAQFVERLFQ